MVHRMSREERAKQFMPFGALKGYPEALEAKTKTPVPRRALSEEMLSELDRRLSELEPGDMVQVCWYDRGEYRDMTGIFARREESAGRLRIGENVIAVRTSADWRGCNCRPGHLPDRESGLEGRRRWVWRQDSVL